MGGFLPEVKFPKLVADRTQATCPYLGEGAERAVFYFTLSIPVNSPSQKETSQLWLADLLPLASPIFSASCWAQRCKKMSLVLLSVPSL